MKNIYITTLCLVFLLTIGFTKPTSENNSNHQLKESKTCVATYDGAEGDYFFFTDKEGRALQFESINVSALLSYELVKGTDIDKVFKIEYDEANIVSLLRIDE